MMNTTEQTTVRVVDSRDGQVTYWRTMEDATAWVESMYAPTSRAWKGLVSTRYHVTGGTVTIYR